MPSVAAVVVVGVCLGQVGGAADAVTLRDGKVVSGAVVESATRNPVVLVVRRDRARKDAQEWARRWEAAEAPSTRRAVVQRRARLAAWSRERATAPVAGGDDRIQTWIDRELANLGVDQESLRTPLMTVKLAGADVRSVARAPRGATRLLRLAWLSGFPDPEAMRVDDLKEALAGRGFDPAGTDPVSVEALQPPRPETESAWLLRRAATEVSFEPGLRFVRSQGLVLPEPSPGQPIGPEAGAVGLSALKDLLTGNPGDTLAPRLRDVAARGRVGALVTALDVAPDFSGVSVEMTLWVRHGTDRWVPGGSQSSRVRTDELGPEAGKELADDPQVALAFRLVESIGLGGVPPEVKRRSLSVGAATRKALGQARTAVGAKLAALSLPVLDAPKGEKPRPDRP